MSYHRREHKLCHRRTPRNYQHHHSKPPRQRQWWGVRLERGRWDIAPRLSGNMVDLKLLGKWIPVVYSSWASVLNTSYASPTPSSAKQISSKHLDAPRSKQWHLIDYIIVRQRDLRDVCITRAMRGAECWTDHRLIRAVLKLHMWDTRETSNDRISLLASPWNLMGYQRKRVMTTLLTQICRQGQDWFSQFDARNAVGPRIIRRYLSQNSSSVVTLLLLTHVPGVCLLVA